MTPARHRRVLGRSLRTQVDAALRAKSDRLDRRVRALRDRVDVASPAPSSPRLATSSPRKASLPEPPGYVVATPSQPPAPPDDDGEAERAADVAAAAALCARTEAAARDVAARAARLADAERALSARLDAATSIDAPEDDGGDDDAPFTASTLLEALEVLAARKSVLVSRARGERRPPSRVEVAWLETLRAEVALLE